MKRLAMPIAGLACAAIATPALAIEASAPVGFAMQPRAVLPTLARPAPTPAAAAAARAKLPAQLSAEQREAYRAVFAAIRESRWSDAAARLDAMPAGPLHAVARAELYLAKGSPKVELEPLIAAISAAPDLPQAQQLARLAATRGATELPVLPSERALVRMAGAPKRSSARSTRSDAVAAALSARVIPLIKDDRPSEAEALLDAAAADLSGDARTEWQQRIAWSYFLTGDDANARRLAGIAQKGFGEWAVQADWVAGLAAWRARDCDAAGQAFTAVASRARDSEMTAAGLFWAARADMACGRPQNVQPRLRTAARMDETFYGLLANAALGRKLPADAGRFDLTGADWARVERRTNLKTAIALSEVGEGALAQELIRHQARIGDGSDHEALLHLAAALELPATQIWLAQNGPAGTRLSAAARYPAPGWTPQGGWRVDKALILAHALQESQFRIDAVSHAGARGLMQIMPGTAQLIAKRKGETVGRLNEPALNFEYGQSYLEQLRDYSGTGGLLPKVIAAYNAGPGSVQKWNERGRNLSDPLLFIEAIPFVETRAYVAIVLRNYWMYQRQLGQESASMAAMAQGMWPRFPGLPGKTALRLDGVGATASAD
ncbi:lytic transglycosylase domain-containing protein [Sphingomonas sp. 1P06PA]|uniref:lytic transglycosylase domain-containing protein n=1 Tax=Sphingomonas sp. 1P06PA TaxID=554121 RepID=UPI0039A61578